MGMMLAMISTMYCGFAIADSQVVEQLIDYRAANDLRERLDNFPTEDVSRTCGFIGIREFRTTIKSYRTTELTVFASEIEANCLALEDFDDETGKMFQTGDMTPNERDARRELFLELQDLHCDDGKRGRTPVVGQKDVYDFLNSELASLEVSSLQQLNDCTSTYCRTSQCLGNVGQ